MAEVPGSPYEPFFTAQPTERPIQLRGVDAPGAAFGENIANAIQTFGGDVQQASGEVFNRALALRKLQIDGTIRDLTTQYYNEVAPIQSDFLAAKGANASQDALNAHLAQLEQVRQKYQQQANQYGSYGVNRFGEEAASLQRSFIREGAVYSATQTKAAAKDSRAAALDMLSRQWAGTPDEFDQKSKKAEGIIREDTAQEGEDENVVQRKVAEFNQGLRVAQILRMSWDRPKDGMLLLEMHKEELGGKEGEVYNRVRSQVENRYLTIVGDQTAQRIVDGVTATGASVEDAVKQVDPAVEGDPVASQIPGMANRIKADVRSKWRGQNYDQTQDNSKDVTYINNAILKNDFKTVAELEASDPKIREIEERLQQTKLGSAFVKGLASSVQKDWNVRHTPEMDRNFLQLWGEATSADPTVKEQFLEHTANINEFVLRKEDAARLMGKRLQILERPEQENPIVKRALSISKIQNGDALHQLRIDKLVPNNEKQNKLYHRWTGALSIAIEEWMQQPQNKGKSPSDQQLEDEIIKPTILSHTEGGWNLGPAGVWGAKKRGQFDLDIPQDKLDAWRTQESKRLKDTYGINMLPSEIDDQSAYGAAWRATYDKLYGAIKGGGER